MLNIHIHVVAFVTHARLHLPERRLCLPNRSDLPAAPEIVVTRLFFARSAARRPCRPIFTW